jgi:hypothetical protein
MTLPSFSGQIRPLPYALWSLALFLSQHLLVWLILRAHGAGLYPDWWFYAVPLRTLAGRNLSDAIPIAAFAYSLVVAWVLAALAFRRAANANASEWIATAAVAPLIQIPAILLLCVLPPRAAAASTEAPSDAPAADSGRAEAVQGLIAGVAVTLFAVAVSTLVFGVYGAGVFMVSPFLVGAVTAYFANRRVDRGGQRTARLVVVATVLGGIALIAAALEGIVCIVLAAPLGIGFAIIGGLLGRAIALAGKRPARQAFSGFALLPVVFALESATSSTTSFESLQTIEINAPAHVVWKAVLHMDSIDEPRALPFRLGIAYPMRGEVRGEGVGAVRHGQFSTGTAVERITEWVPQRKIAFVVVTDVPSIHELSPYEYVHAPHAVGYFTTSLTSFELVPQPGGRTEVVERTSHQLRLEPILYWLPMARWIVHANNARILTHIKRQSERAAGAGNS